MKTKLKRLFKWLRNQISGMVNNSLENGFSRSPALIWTVESSNMKTIIKGLGLVEKMNRCYVCDKQLTTDNLTVVYFRNGNWIFVCDKPSCQTKEDIANKR